MSAAWHLAGRESFDTLVGARVTSGLVPATHNVLIYACVGVTIDVVRVAGMHSEPKELFVDGPSLA